LAEVFAVLAIIAFARWWWAAKAKKKVAGSNAAVFY